MSETSGTSGAAVEALGTCVFKVCGLSETELGELLAPVDFGRDARLSIIARYPDLTVRLAVDNG